MANTVSIDRWDPLGWLLYKLAHLGLLGTITIPIVFFIVEVFFFPWESQGIPVWMLIWALVMTPVLWGTYYSAREYVPNLPRNMKENKIIKHSTSSDFETAERQLGERYSSPVVTLMAVVTALAFMVAFPLHFWIIAPPPYMQYTCHKCYALVIIFFNFYIGSLTVFRHFISIIWLRDCFKTFTVQVRPLHPDRAGGFGFIGSQFLGLTGIVVVAGYWISAERIVIPYFSGQPVDFAPDLLWGGILYLIVTAASFILPLWTTHIVMSGFKSKKLSSLSERFEKSAAALDTGGHTAFESAADHLETNEKVYTLLDNAYPTWPVSRSVLRRLGVAAIFPVVNMIVVIVEFIRSF